MIFSSEQAPRILQRSRTLQPLFPGDLKFTLRPRRLTEHQRNEQPGHSIKPDQDPQQSQVSAVGYSKKRMKEQEQNALGTYVNL